MLTGQNTWKSYVVVAVLVLLLVGIWMSQTGVPAQSREYLQDAWHHITSPATSSSPATTEKPPSSSIVPSATAAAPQSKPSDEGATKDGVNQMDAAMGANTSEFNFDKWFYQYDLPYDLPAFDTAKLKDLAPHNYQGPGHETFATYFASRSPSLQDPYFLATQQVVYRLLWDPRSASKKHPVVVFVAPFVTQAHRDMFAAAGAMVKELEQIEWHPETPGVAGRLIDMFSKLEMWRHTEFSRIAYTDSDAFALENIDRIFDLAPDLRCKVERLHPEDAAHADALCDYVFAGHAERPDMVNAGVIVIKPNLAMHDMLRREMTNTSNFDNGLAEQAFLNYVFRPDGAFPPTHLEAAWNGFPDVKQNGDPLFVVHAKLWVPFVGPEHWAYDAFNTTWEAMRSLYDSEEFVQAREQDQKLFAQLNFDA